MGFGWIWLVLHGLRRDSGRVEFGLDGERADEERADLFSELVALVLRGLEQDYRAALRRV